MIGKGTLHKKSLTDEGYPPFSPLRLYECQVTANVVMGRSHLGVHWRMDGVYGAEMGETGAIRRLQQVHFRSRIS